MFIKIYAVNAVILLVFFKFEYIFEYIVII